MSDPTGVQLPGSDVSKIENISTAGDFLRERYDSGQKPLKTAKYSCFVY